MASGANRRRRRQRLLDSRQWLGITAVAATAVVAGALVVAALSQASAPPTAAYRLSTTAPVVSPSETSAAPVTVSVLSDSHAYNADSWFRQTVEANAVPGVQLGAFESQPGISSTGLQARLDAAAAPGGLVLVQAGTNDLLSAISPEETVTNLEALWDGIVSRGASPVAMLVPPSATRAQATVELNDLIRSAAAARTIPLLDVYSDVSDGAGNWQQGLSGDGVHSNAAGSEIMTRAAQAQLQVIVGS